MGEEIKQAAGAAAFRPLWIVVGAVLAFGLQLFPAPPGMSVSGWLTASLFVLMLVWWVSEAVPIPVTSLLPLVVLPIAGILPIRDAAVPYASPIVLLLMGGFIIAKSVERWNLHTRIALGVVAKFGGRPDAMILGFMVAAAILSMWISNTATAIMLTPIALSVAMRLKGDRWSGDPLSIALLLGIAWACSIGGLGTPVGTPTNLIVIGYLEQNFGQTIDFVSWMTIGLPMVLVLVPLAWLVLTRIGLRVSETGDGPGQDVIAQARTALGPISVQERRVAYAFAVIALLWIFRRPLTEIEIGGSAPLVGMTDHVIAIAGAILLFLIPSGHRDGGALLDWSTAERIPWGVLLLFGGGLSLAAAITASGLGDWMGNHLTAITTLPLLLVIGILVIFVIFFTEVASNVATASALMPIIGAVAAASAFDPLLLALPVALAASCAFMLPMATGPNAIAYASGSVSMANMARLGLILNVLGIAAISLFGAFALPALVAQL